MVRLFSKIVRKHSEVGSLRLIDVIAHNILPRRLFDFSFQVVVARALDPDAPPPPELPGLRVANVDDAESIDTLGTSPSAMNGRFESGCKAWLVEWQGRPIACDWLGADNRKSHWEWLIMRGRTDDIWHEYFEVRQEARGNGIGPKMRAHVIFDCQQKGYRRLLGNVELSNHRSIRAMQKAGYEPVTRFWYFRLGNLTLIRYGGRTRVGRWHEEEPHVMQLN